VFKFEKLEYVKPDIVNINLVEKLYFRKREPDNKLIFEIKQTGIIYPLICLRKNKEVYLISGLKRYKAAIILNIYSLPVLYIENSNFPIENVLLIIQSMENIISNSLNVFEASRLICKLTAHRDVDYSQRAITMLLKKFKLELSTAAFIDNHISTLINLTGKPEILKLLANMDKVFLNIYYKILGKFHVTVAEFRKIKVLMEELFLINESMTGHFVDELFAKIDEAKSLTELIEYLKFKRYPFISEYNRKIYKEVRKFNKSFKDFNLTYNGDMDSPLVSLNFLPANYGSNMEFKKKLIDCSENLAEILKLVSPFNIDETQEDLYS